MLLMIDNFDSFTYNLVQYFQVLGARVEVIRNNALSCSQCLDLNPKYLVLSPGPGSPSDAGITKELILAAQGKIPILGICLGMQAIAEVYGATVVRAPIPVHGKTSKIIHQQQGIFHNLPSGLTATRYHSLMVKKDSLPTCLTDTAHTEDGIIMGLKHNSYPISGLQFHPESILTPEGMTLLKNFIDHRH